MPEPLYTGHDEEKGSAATRISRVVTPGGHPADFSQPAFPVQHRKYGNPTPLGLMSFGTGFFLSSAYTLRAQGVATFNLAVPVFILFGGLTQTLVGWFEMFLGNTYAATIFASYGAWNMTFGCIFIPAFGVLDAYTLEDGTLSPQFDQAMAIFNFAWVIVSVLFILASLRSSVGILVILTFTALAFLALGINSATGADSARIAGGVFGMIATAAAYWTAMAGYWTSDTTFPWIRVPPGDLSPKEKAL